MSALNADNSNQYKAAQRAYVQFRLEEGLIEDHVVTISSLYEYSKFLFRTNRAGSVLNYISFIYISASNRGSTIDRKLYEILRDRVKAVLKANSIGSTQATPADGADALIVGNELGSDMEETTRFLIAVGARSGNLPDTIIWTDNTVVLYYGGSEKKGKHRSASLQGANVTKQFFLAIQRSIAAHGSLLACVQEILRVRPKLSLHSFRRGFAVSVMIHDTPATSELLAHVGWSSINTLARYCKGYKTFKASQVLNLNGYLEHLGP